MTRKIFWSWQSDAPKRETRDVIQVALHAAIRDVAAELDLVKAPRVEVDQAANGVIGVAPIAETILEKIDRCSIFVGDITAVGSIGRGRDRKLLPNPNVMLELGYARRALGMARLIPVFNRAIRSMRFEDLPFDLRHLTGAIGFDLPEGAPRSDLRRVRVELRERLAGKIRAMIAEEPGTVAIEPSWHAALPHDPGIWEESYNPLPVNCMGVGQLDIIVAAPPRIFVRIIPAEQGGAPKYAGGLFPGHEDPLVPIGGLANIMAGRTLNGHAVFEKLGEDHTTKSIAQWYRDTGEIWAISAWGFYARDGGPVMAYDEIINDLAAWIPRAVRTIRAAGGSGPMRLRLGASGLRSVQWWQARPSPGAAAPHGLADFVVKECALASAEQDAVFETISQFMDAVTESFGVADLTAEQIAHFALKTT